MDTDNEFTFMVYIISAGRASRGPITAKCFLDYTHVVRKSQEQDYLDNGFKNVWAIEDDLINGYDKVFNYLVENAKEDVIAVVDDDIDSFLYRTDVRKYIDSPETNQAEFERLAQQLVDLNLGLAFGAPTDNPKFYREEFSWAGMPGAFKIVNRNCIKARMDEKILRNVDVDYVLQELLKNRICLDAKYYCTRDYTDNETQTSGSSYSFDDVTADLETMKVRWGRCFDYSGNVVKILVER